MMKTRGARLFRNPTWQASFALGGLVGFSVFLFFFGWRLLNPLDASWLFDYHPDPPVAYLGWLSYRYADWHLPFIGLTDQMTYPSSISVIFTDSIPLLAVPAKLLRFMLPRSFHYFGWWIALCYLLQGSLAALLCRKLAKGLMPQALLAAFFSFAPILIQRAYIHLALGGQWLLLLCLLAWFHLDFLRCFRRLLAVCAALSLLAVGIHQYYVPMVFGLMAGLLLNHMLAYKPSWRQPAAFAGAAAAGALAVFFLGGFRQVGGGSLAGAGLGENSANLNTFWNSQNAFAYLLGRPVYGGMQYEGQAYLGAGMLLLLFVALALGLAKLWQMLREKCFKNWLGAHRNLCVFAGVGLLFFVFALGPVVTLGDRVLFTVPLPGAIKQVLSIYRSTGRFVWPAFYLLYLGVFAVLLRLWNRRVALVLLTLALALQIGDVAPYHATTGLFFRQERAHITSARPLEAVSEEYGLLLLVTPQARGAAAGHNLVYHALRKGDLKVNGATVFHVDKTELENYRNAAVAELERGVVHEDTIYVYAVGDALPKAGLHWYALGDELVLGLPRPTDRLPACPAGE